MMMSAMPEMPRARAQLRKTNEKYDSSRKRWNDVFSAPRPLPMAAGSYHREYTQVNNELKKKRSRNDATTKHRRTAGENKYSKTEAAQENERGNRCSSLRPPGSS